MRNLKIAVDARTLGSRPSGVGMYLNDFLEQLIKYEEFEWVLFTDVAESEYIKKFQDRGIKVIVWGKPVYKSAAVYSYFVFIKKHLKCVRPDIFWEVNTLIPIKLGKGFKTIITVHDMFPIQYTRYFGGIYSAYFRFTLKSTFRRTDMIFYNSEQTKEDTENYFPEAKNISSCNAYIISNPLESHVVPKDDNYFLYIGNMEKRKGVDILLKAYREYRKKGGIRPLILAGKIQENDVGNLIETYVRSVEGITYLGYVSNTVRYDLYNNCSCFVFPSMAEGFGMPLLEVMKHEKPVLTSDLKIFDEIIGNCGSRFSIAGNEEQRIKNLCLALLEFDMKPDSGYVDKKAYKDTIEKYRPERLGGIVRDFINNQMNND